MATIPNAVASALSTLAAVSGQMLQYRLTPTGSWTPWVGAFLQQTQPTVLAVDEKRSLVIGPQTARVKAPVGSIHLTPGVSGSQVQDQTGTIWAVMGIDHALGQSIYLLQRTIVQSQGADRGIVS